MRCLRIGTASVAVVLCVFFGLPPLLQHALARIPPRFSATLAQLSLGGLGRFLGVFWCFYAVFTHIVAPNPKIDRTEVIVSDSWESANTQLSLKPAFQLGFTPSDSVIVG